VSDDIHFPTDYALCKIEVP